MTPRVSVVLPVHDGEASVARAIRSIQRQTLDDWELVVYDDGSNDRSRAVCEEVAAGDRRIRVIAGGRNRGLAAAMNRLVAEAAADLIAVQEQDDESVPQRLARQVAVLDADPTVGVVSGVAEWHADGEPVARFPGRLARGCPYPDAMVEYLLVEQCKVVNAAVMFRRACLDAQRPPFDPGARMSIDWQFFIDVAHRHRFAGIPEVLVAVDRSPGRRSLTADKALQAAEARRCLGVVRRRYLRDPASPVSIGLLRRAWATELDLEGRWRSGVAGLALVGAACTLDPRRAELRRSFGEMGRRGLRRATRRFRATVAPCS